MKHKRSAGFVIFVLVVSFVLKDAAGAGRQSQSVIDVVELSVADAQRRMAAGTLTSRALTRAYLDRIAALDDGGPRLNAVIDLNPAAMKDAEARDAERKAGRARGPLHGIPILVKDNIDVAGMINAAGSLAFTDNRPKADAFIIRRLRDAGVVNDFARTHMGDPAASMKRRARTGGAQRADVLPHAAVHFEPARVQPAVAVRVQQRVRCGEPAHLGVGHTPVRGQEGKQETAREGFGQAEWRQE